MGKPVPPLIGPGLVTRRIEVRPSDVVLVRAYLEASEGLGALFAERGGELVLASPVCLEAGLDAFIDDLEEEMPVLRKPLPKPCEPGGLARWVSCRPAPTSLAFPT